MPIDPSQWRLNIGGIPVKLVSRKGKFSLTNSTAIEEYIIESDRLLDLATVVFPAPGTTGEFGSSSNPLRVVFNTSLQFSGFNSLVAQDMTWEALIGDGFSGGVPTDPFGDDVAAVDGTYSEFLKVAIMYATTPANDDTPDTQSPLTFLDVNSAAGGTFLSIPLRGQMAWRSTTKETQSPESKKKFESTDNDGPDVPFTVTEVTTDWSLRWPQVPFDYFESVLVGRLRASLGKVNSVAMNTIFSAPPETILMLGYDAKETFTFRAGFPGRSPYDVTMTFSEKNMAVTENRGSTVKSEITGTDTADTYGDPEVIQVTHNHFYRPGVGWRRTARFRGVGFTGTPEPAFEATDLNAIFSVSE